MSRLRSSFPILVAIALVGSGCTSDSQARLSDEVSGRVKPGMTAQAASSSLTAAGFACERTNLTTTRDLLCDRERSFYVFSTCAQHVLLSFDPAAQTVRAIQVSRPACGGL